MTVLWEGQRESLTAAASGGRVVSARYRITEDAIHFEAGLLSTRAEVVPLWAVMDVDLVQTITQKARRVGDLVVRLDPQGAKYGQTQVKLESIKDPHVVRDLLSRHANAMRRAMLDHQHDRDIQKRQAGAMNVNVGAPDPSSVPPAAAPASDARRVSSS